MSTSTNIWAVATRTRDAIRTALASAGNPVARAGIYPAAIAWDKCECGTLAVAFQRQYVTTNFPAINETEQLQCAGGFLAVDFVVEVMRCAPQPVGRAIAPDIGPLEEAAALILNDAWVTISTVQCLLPELVDENIIVQYLVRPQPFAGPSGGCVGSALGFTVAVEQML